MQPQQRESHVPKKSLAREPPQEDERESEATVPEKKSLAWEPPQEDEREVKATRRRKALTRRREKQRRLRKKAEVPVPVKGWEEGPQRKGE